jgi:tetratricopeptide (TPR) repeat protein
MAILLQGFEFELAMAKPRSKSILHAAADYDFRDRALERHWPRLHRGDCEPYPTVSGVAALVAAHPALEPSVPIDHAVEALRDAWRAFHNGDFQESERRGLAIGLLGFNVANKAANMRATYLDGAKKKLATFLEVARRAERLQRCAPSMPNAWYLHALALGRYAQGLSVMQALGEGIGGKVKTDLEKALELEPRHGDAHIAFGAYYSEIISKLGALAGKLTYGASSDAAVKHFERGLKLNPDSAVGRVEYAKGLLMMFGGGRIAQATRLYERAAKCRPADAVERLDLELAQAELDD